MTTLSLKCSLGLLRLSFKMVSAVGRLWVMQAGV